MTTVTIDRLPGGSITAFRSSGHAGYAESGSDIICAAISAILQTAALGLREEAGLFIALEMDEEQGEMEVILERELSLEQRNKADIILNTMWLGLLSLQSARPDNLKIVERRC